MGKKTENENVDWMKENRERREKIPGKEGRAKKIGGK